MHIAWNYKTNENYGIFSFKIIFITVLRNLYIFAESTCALSSIVTPKTENSLFKNLRSKLNLI